MKKTLYFFRQIRHHAISPPGLVIMLVAVIAGLTAFVLFVLDKVVSGSMAEFSTDQATAIGTIWVVSVGLGVWLGAQIALAIERTIASVAEVIWSRVKDLELHVDGLQLRFERITGESLSVPKDSKSVSHERPIILLIRATLYCLPNAIAASIVLTIAAGLYHIAGLSVEWVPRYLIVCVFFTILLLAIITAILWYLWSLTTRLRSTVVQLEDEMQYPHIKTIWDVVRRVHDLILRFAS